MLINLEKKKRKTNDLVVTLFLFLIKIDFNVYKIKQSF